MELCDYNVAKQWAELSNAAKTYSNGGKFSCAGNQCKLLLNNIDKLQEICEKKSFFTGLDYVDAFKKFQVVVNDCFSSELQKNYDKHIEEFKGSYEHLGISITPKVHVVFHHVAQFCSRYKMGLGFFSEQATESTHFDYNKHFENFKVPEISDQFFSKTWRAVCSYNSSHL